MKKFDIFFITALMAMAGMLFTACGDDNDNVKQPEPQDPPTITISDQYTATKSSVTVTVIPGETTVNYRFGISANASTESFENGTLVNIQSVSGNNPSTYTFNDLAPRTGYYIFAQAFGEDGLTGTIVTATVNTLKDEKSVYIAPGYEIDLYEITFTTAPGNEVAYYDIALGVIADQESFLDGSMPGIIRVADGSEQFYNYDQLEENTNYVVFTQGYDSDDNKGTPVIWRFATKELMPHVEVTIHDVTAAYFYADMVPNEKVGYYLFYSGLEDNFKPYRDDPERAIDFVKSKFVEGLASLLRVEHQNFLEYNGMQAGIDFVALVLPADKNDQIVGPVQEYYFSTPAYDESNPDPLMDLEVYDVTDTSAKAKYQMRENTIAYVLNCHKAEDYEGARSWSVTLDVWSGDWEIEDIDVEFMDLEPDTDYIAWAYPFNVNGSDQGAKDYIEYPFRTAPGDTGRSYKGTSSKTYEQLTGELPPSQKRTVIPRM